MLEHFTVMADGEPLAVWARRPARVRGAILLVHGRTWSARPDFDLQVPGESRSVLAGLAARGFAAYAVDLRGYGDSPRDRTGWLTPRRAAADVEQVLDWIAGEQHGVRPALLGWSNGALIAQLVAQQRPKRIAALVLYGYPGDPDATITADPSADTGAAPMVRNTAADAAADFQSPAVTSRATVAAYVTAALAADPVRAEWRSTEQLNALDPSRVRVPTLLLQGEHDPEPPDALQRLFTRLGTVRKTWITLAGGDHAALLEDTTPAFLDALAGFLEKALP